MHRYIVLELLIIGSSVCSFSLLVKHCGDPCVILCVTQHQYKTESVSRER